MRAARGVGRIVAVLGGVVVAGGVGGGCGRDARGVAGIGGGGTGGAMASAGTAGGGGTGVGAGAAGATGATAGAGASGGGAAGGAGAGASGGGTVGGAGGGPGTSPAPDGVWTVDGGDASAGRASAGGTIHVVAQGAITLGAATPTPFSVPPPPADATVIDGTALGADVSVAGNIRIDDKVLLSGADPVRRIASASGDIYLSGSVTSGDAGGSARGLVLNAPAGTVYVTGTLDSSGAIAGESAGIISISARRIVVTGSLSANGAEGPVGGNGGAITTSATEMIFLSGSVQAHGGAGMTAGGTGGALSVDTAGTVQAGVVDVRGGNAAGSDASAGMAGTIRVGETTPPMTVYVSASLSARGGAGYTAGGNGGAVTIEPRMGNLVIGGSVDFGGGAAALQPGKGGTFTGVAGEAAGDRMINGGDIRLIGQLSGNGGSIRSGSVGNGAVAGTVTIQPVSILGGLVVDAAARVALNGGASGGNGIAGGGGHLFFTTSDGDLTVAGQLSLLGGDAPDPGGTGGLGGAVDIFSDANFDGFGGHLLLDVGSIIDASGGNGTIGGNARNDGTDSVASFPDDMEMIAVLINCDGKHGTTDNWLDNRGLIRARGGRANGNGGDIAYHGISPDGDSSPPSGDIDNAGNGTGLPGDFRGE